MKKRFLALLLALCMALSLAACAPAATTEPETAPAQEATAAPEAAAPTAAPVVEPVAPASLFTAGTYEATVTSVAGAMTVSVTLSEDKIESIDVLECNDTAGVYEVAVERIPAMIVENQTLNVDAVTGATLTSANLKRAISEAIAQGCSDMSALQQTAVSYVAAPVADMETDVVIVGGGIAGLAAAVACTQNDLDVVLVEKNSYLGGSAILSEANIADLGMMMLGICDAVSYMEQAGMEFIACPTHGAGGCIQMANVPEGSSSIAAMMSEMARVSEEKGALILTDTTCIDLFMNVKTDSIGGVVVQPRGSEEAATINARAVILATGGFQQNPELMNQYMPELEGIRISSGPGATGDAIAWVEKLGGRLEQPESGVRGYSINASTGYRTAFGFGISIFVDKTGKSFTESNDYSDVPLLAYELFGDETYYAIITQTMFEQEGFDHELFDHMIEAGSTYKFDSIDAMAEAYDLPDLKATLEAAGMADESAYYISPSKPSAYSTLGGIKVNLNGSVLNYQNELIHGLFAVGEVIGNYGSQNYGFYCGQLGASMCMATKAADYIAKNFDKIGTGKAIDYHHMCITCKDLDAYVDFWVNFMGFQALSVTDYPTASLSDKEDIDIYNDKGGMHEDLYEEMFFSQPDSLQVVMCVDPEGGISIELWSSPNMELTDGENLQYLTTGVHEFGLMVDDIDYWFNKVTEAGFTTTTKQPWWAGSGYSFIWIDPEGNLIQMSERGAGPQWQFLAQYIDESWETGEYTKPE